MHNEFHPKIRYLVLALRHLLASGAARMSSLRLAAMKRYVFTFPQNDTQGISLFWRSSILDNWTTAEHVNPPGYVFVRIEGYVMPALW